MSIQNFKESAQNKHHRTRHIAAGLLFVMALISVVTTVLPALHIVRDSIWLSTTRAGARAGFIGGVADWFAVTALFRHPFGLPIPHTAILVKQQARLADATGRFIASQFFESSEVARALEAANLSRRIGPWLRHERTRRACVEAVQRTLPGLLDRVEDGTAASTIRRAFELLVSGKASTPFMVKILRALMHDDLHKEVVSFLLVRLKGAIQEKEDTLRNFIQRRVTEQGGRVVGWVIGPSVAQKVMTSLYAELDGIDPSDPEMRETISGWFQREIDLLEQDDARRSRLEGRLMQLLQHDSILAWSAQIWHRLRAQIDSDRRAQDGVTAQLVDITLVQLSRLLLDDDGFAKKTDQALTRTVIHALPVLRDHLSQFISGVMAKWDGETLTKRLEERIGKDLQFIRINGTIVGFAIGMTLELSSYVFRVAIR